MTPLQIMPWGREEEPVIGLLGSVPGVLASVALIVLLIAALEAAAPDLEVWQGWFGSWTAVPLAIHGIMPAKTSGMNFMSSRTFEAVAPPHDWWDWYAAYMDARKSGSTPDEASAAAGHYMAEVKHVVVG